MNGLPAVCPGDRGLDVDRLTIFLTAPPRCLRPLRPIATILKNGRERISLLFLDIYFELATKRPILGDRVIMREKKRVFWKKTLIRRLAREIGRNGRAQA